MRCRATTRLHLLAGVLVVAGPATTALATEQMPDNAASRAPQDAVRSASR